ncbi:hypothetical protein FHQ18_02445 [Deferribacter autotrophicus]|uniref:Uncharacterized protein n=1 Tax=Deferribacter autotrophicus TaxID=500465 RepID=A0A5A8F779_9BACT|nr:hypothetical protein [Deferribacter autotrophicus]KAA0258828.1 hypothetical protein FHQ18_02445 [Deferribacter autotrophicus]
MELGINGKVIKIILSNTIIMRSIFSPKNYKQMFCYLNKCKRIYVILRLILLIISVNSILLTFGCTVKVPMSPKVDKFYVEEKLPVEAGLLISEETKNYVFRGHPESFTAGARPHEFPLGKALEDASIQVFSRIFKRLYLVRTHHEAKKIKIFIEPNIEEFHFRYDQLSYAGFAVAVISKIKIHVVLGSGETIIWEKSIESPEQRKGPWVFNLKAEKEVGESATDALIYSLNEAAKEIVTNRNIWEYVEKVYK